MRCTIKNRILLQHNSDNVSQDITENKVSLSRGILFFPDCPAIEQAHIFTSVISSFKRSYIVDFTMSNAVSSQPSGSLGSTNLESLNSTSSRGRTVIQDIQPNERVNSPADEEGTTVPGEGFFATLVSICLEQKDSIGQTWHDSCWGKAKVPFMCIYALIYVPLSPFLRERASWRKVTHYSIMYFYILMSCTIVFNLWELRNKEKYTHLSYQFLQYFEATLMVLALIAMIHIAWATGIAVMWAARENNFIFYFRTGLYVFGVSSTVYTALNIYNSWSCSAGLNTLVNISKFLFIVGQILFLNYYYQANLPCSGRYIRVPLAHILGTNLSLWIWTLCEEVYTPSNKKISSDCTPIYLGHSEKYFYPLFVEYLLLVASMIYELWMEVSLTEDRRQRACNPRYVCETNQEELEDQTLMSSDLREQQPVHAQPNRRRRKFSSSLALSFVLGLAFGSIFLAFMLAANDSSSKDEKLYDHFLIVNICFYCTQLIACYVIKVCSQSQPSDRFNVFNYIHIQGV